MGADWAGELKWGSLFPPESLAGGESEAQGELCFGDLEG